jgi:hypothetical protein
VIPVRHDGLRTGDEGAVVLQGCGEVLVVIGTRPEAVKL